MSRNRSSRRGFLKQATAASAALAGFPYFVRSSALGKDGAVAPSNRIVFGAIGTGGQGRGNMHRFMGRPDCQIVAVCDVDANNREHARKEVNNHYKNEDCKAYKDFRQLLERTDIDAVSIGTPDHWHALTSIAAAYAGKDIYCEKPLANSVAEGRAISDAARKNKRVLQTGSQERSGGRARYACELVLNGRIGKLHTIRINLPCDDGHHKEALEQNKKPHPEEPVPAHFDYDFWLGHTEVVPYTPRRCHFWWRFNLRYGGGEMTDRGAHVIDIGQLGNGTDETGPVHVEAKGKRDADALYNAFFEYEFVNTFANGVKMIGSSNGPRGLKFEGDEGWIFVHIHGANLEASKESILKETIKESEINLGRTENHHANFVQAIRDRKQPFASAEIGHRTASICHLNNIAMITGKPFKWDPVKETSDQDEVNALLAPKMRAPWHL